MQERQTEREHEEGEREHETGFDFTQMPKFLNVHGSNVIGYAKTGRGGEQTSERVANLPLQ